MKAKRSKLPKLPLDNLDANDFIDLLGKAHASLARFDERVPVSSELFENEARYSEHSSKETAKGLKALKHVCKEIQKNAFSWKLLCEAHAIIKEGGPPKDVGKFRDRQNWIGPEGCTEEGAFLFPPKPEEMHKQLENLKRYYSYKEIDPLIQLAIFYAQLINIHPFMDGNGRVCRLIIPLFLYKKKLTKAPNFFMSRYIRKHQDDYLKYLHLIQYKGKWTGWIRFFLKGIIESAEKNLSMAKDHR